MDFPHLKGPALLIDSQRLQQLPDMVCVTHASEAINDTIAGCGVHALVEENGVPNEVVVSFPNVPGIPKEFEEIKEIIEDILPAHLLITYNFSAGFMIKGFGG